MTKYKTITIFSIDETIVVNNATYELSTYRDHYTFDGDDRTVVVPSYKIKSITAFK